MATFKVVDSLQPQYVTQRWLAQLWVMQRPLGQLLSELQAMPELVPPEHVLPQLEDRLQAWPL
jgi:hypothetical protein